MAQAGLIHLYTGDGKGKTTAAVGLCARAAGCENRVVFAQFMKGRNSGELDALAKLGCRVLRLDCSPKFIFDMDDAEKAEYAGVQCTTLEEAFEAAKTADLLILDEVVSAVTTGMVPQKRLIDLLQHKPEGLEVVLTGRDAPRSLRNLAHYVTEMRAEKHPYDSGVPARRGIEF